MRLLPIVVSQEVISKISLMGKAFIHVLDPHKKRIFNISNEAFLFKKTSFALGKHVLHTCTSTQRNWRRK